MNNGFPQQPDLAAAVSLPGWPGHKGHNPPEGAFNKQTFKDVVIDSEQLAAASYVSRALQSAVDHWAKARKVKKTAEADEHLEDLISTLENVLVILTGKDLDE